MTGFYIKELSVIGSGRRNATIHFEKGANLVTGASDTGKSYIFSAISYALGASQEPKAINESTGYTDVYLKIGLFHDQSIYLFHRKLGANAIFVKQWGNTDAYEDYGNAPYKKFTTSGSVDKLNHISTFLLSLCDLQGVRILQNQKEGKTNNLSFSSLRKLTFVDEERIIKSSSPFYFTEQYIDQIRSQSLLSLLLTGNDFSDVNMVEGQKVKETRINGKLEFLTSQVSKFSREKEQILTHRSDGTVVDRQTFFDIDRELKDGLEQARELTERKNEAARVLQNLHEKLQYKLELLKRFHILDKQYLSDNERLNFILESSALSSQLGDTICPICSSPLDDNHLLHVSEHENFREAAIEEINKNNVKLFGLRSTITELKKEEVEVRDGIEAERAAFRQIETELSDNLTPRIDRLKLDLRAYLEVERQLNKIMFIDEQIRLLHDEKNRLEKMLKQKETVEETSIVDYSQLHDLSERIESRLKSWNYEPHVAVDFDSSYRIFDIVISGKARRSYGKGKRSISYTACMIGLLDYCHSLDKNFSYLLMFDSPLTTFEEKKRQHSPLSDILPEKILAPFFTDLLTIPENSQVIIFDNKEPDEETQKKISGRINMHVFTGTDEGRSGFFPISI
jgi:hypothetical protein